MGSEVLLTLPDRVPIRTQSRPSTFRETLNHGSFLVFIGIGIQLRKELLQCSVPSSVLCSRSALSFLSLKV